MDRQKAVVSNRIEATGSETVFCAQEASRIMRLAGRSRMILRGPGFSHVLLTTAGRIWFAALASMALCLYGDAAKASGIDKISSMFDVDDEGWRITGDSVSAVPTFIGTGGNPGGFIRGFDRAVGGVWYWLAPSTFLGNVLSAYGNTLEFDLRMRGSGPLFDTSDLILDGAAISLHIQATVPVPQDVPWTTYVVSLSETAGWRTDSLSGPVATQSQMQMVLGDLTGLRIRGEFITGSDNGDLDRVILNGVPEPNCFWAIGIFSFLIHRKSRRTDPVRPSHRSDSSVIVS